MRVAVAALVAGFVVAGAGAATEAAPRAERVALAGLESGVAEIALAARAEGQAAAVREARAAGLATSGGRVEIVVRTQSGLVSLARAALASRGATVVRAHGSLVKALVPVAELESLGRAPGVGRLEAPQRFHVAALTGEGVAAANADVFHLDGLRGAGVKIGIVDAGFGQYPLRQVAGELPSGSALKTLNYCHDFEGLVHGTGVAEIVHELAPEAELHLICIEDAVDMAAATDYAIANGIQIVNQSGGFINTSRGDGSGGPDTPDGIVARARAAGILWVASAGNSAKYHWSGSFVDADNDGIGEFAAGDEGNDFGTRAGEQVCAYLKWDSWPTTALDYDLALTTPAGAILGGSFSVQTGTQEPLEGFCFPSSTESTYALAIRGAPGSSSLRFDIFLAASARGTLQHQVAAGSLIEPASGPQALAAAALCWATGGLASYSSQGPVIGGGTKPDVAGFDSVSSVTYGGFSICEKSGFAGTSASAPHVAAAAALLKQLHPGFGPAELQAALEAMAVDLGAPGKDNAYGAGRLRLPARPTPTTSFPSSVGRRTAVLAGSVQPHRWEGRAYFEYSLDPGFAAPAVTTPAPFAAAASAVPLSVQVDGLEPTTTYHARLVVENEHGVGRGTPVSFTTTSASAPTLSTVMPTNRGQTGVTLNGLVNANNAVTSYSFEYGPSPSLGLTTPAGSIGGDTTAAVAASLTGLSPGTLYYYRLSGTNSFGSAQSALASFTTLPNAPPVVATGAASGVGSSSATVSATVDPRGNATTYAFEYGTSPALGASKPGGTLPAGDSPQAVSAGLTGLAPTTTYYYRVVATNSAGGPVLGATSAFTTGAAPPPPPPPPAPQPPPVVPPPFLPTTVIPGPTTTSGPAATGRTWNGSAGANVYRGGAGSDRIDGRAGADRLFGGAGSDRITGGPGRDVIDAGAGNDRILARDRTRDVIRCGTGRDTVLADKVDSIARDCEVVGRT